MRLHAPTRCANTAQLKRDLNTGARAIDELLAYPPPFVHTANVAELLLALPRYGPVKVNKLLARCRIAPSKTVGGLTQRQRDEFVSLLANPPAHLANSRFHPR